MTDKADISQIRVGVVGLGLMGSSIVTALLVAGHPVSAVAPLPRDAEGARQRIRQHLGHCVASGLCTEAPEAVLDRLAVTEDYGDLRGCCLVIECVIEKPEIKADIYGKIAAATGRDTIIGTNTSAIPISTLQQFVPDPGRFLGIHWAEPAYLTRFLEITCGSATDPEVAARLFTLAHRWGKEPTLLKKDIRGFITNRLMYSVYREIFHLLDQGIAGKEELDKAFRYDAGSWITLMGIFRRLDYTGFGDFDTVIRKWLPELSVSGSVPAEMQQVVDSQARGIFNGRGLFGYDETEARRWEEAFAAFNREIHALASDYSREKISRYLAAGS